MITESTLRPQNAALAGIVQRDWLHIGAAPAVSVADILLAVYSVTGVGAAEVMSPRRDAGTVTARHMVMYLAREMTGYSFPQIGRAMGAKHHTSVMHGARRIADRMLYDSELVALEDRCRKKVTGVSMARVYRQKEVQ